MIRWIQCPIIIRSLYTKDRNKDKPKDTDKDTGKSLYKKDKKDKKEERGASSLPEEAPAPEEEEITDEMFEAMEDI